MLKGKREGKLELQIWADKSCSPRPTCSPSSPPRLVYRVRLVSDTKCLTSTSIQCSARSLALTVLDDSTRSNDYIRSYSTAFSYSSSRILHQRNKGHQRKRIIIFNEPRYLESFWPHTKLPLNCMTPENNSLLR